VEGDKSGNACTLCDGTGLTRGEMSPLCSNFGIHVEERRLYKELISPARQRDRKPVVLRTETATK
jgi:hypothetical protein